MITLPMLRAAGVSDADSVIWIDSLNAAAEEFSINTVARVVPWLANMAHECAGFTRLTENLNYSPEALMRLWPVTPKRLWGFSYEEAERYAHQPERIANRVYANRYGNKPTTVLAPPNQVTNYIRTIGSSATTPLVRITPGGAFDAGFDRARATFQGLPVVEIAGITSTEMYMVDVNDMTLLVHRDLKIDPVIGSPEEENYQISTAVCLKVEHRNWHGKMTGITA
jgi:hypothetical protein